MESYQTHVTAAPPIAFPPVPNGPLKSIDVIRPASIDTDTSMSDYDRTQRAASVLSGMSAEDMEAAETLNSLHASMHILQPHSWDAQLTNP